MWIREIPMRKELLNKHLKAVKESVIQGLGKEHPKQRE